MAAAPPRTITPNASLPAKVVPQQPNQTLYVRGLPSSKIQKQDLRTALYMLFSTYGAVLDVVALKANGMRGQAHVVFRDMQTSTQAMRSLQGAEFLGGKLRIEYGRGKSHAISRLDGSFKAPSALGAAAVEVTELQQSIFNAPGPNTSGAAPPATSQGLPAKPPSGAPLTGEAAPSPADAGDNRGQKRPREDEDDDSDDSDVAMEEDSDDE